MDTREPPFDWQEAVDDPAQALSAFDDRHRAARTRDAVAEVAGEVVGYCGIQALGGGEFTSFRVSDPRDRRAGAVETAIVGRVESWLGELAANPAPPQAPEHQHPSARRAAA